MLLSIFFQLINSQSTSTISILNNTETITRGNETNQTSISTISGFNMTTINYLNTTTNLNETTTTISANITSINESTTSVFDSNPPSKSSSKSRWWLFAPILTVVVVISIGFIHYYRRHGPYRRFLQNWRSRDDERDHIILQLEQPDISNGQWARRLSFA